MARPAAAGPSPLHHRQRLPARPTPPSFPLSREPRAGARRGGVSVSRRPCHPKLVIPAPYSRVIPAEAGIQRGAERGNPTKTYRIGTPKRQPPVVGAFREWPVPPQRDPHPSITTSAYRPEPLTVIPAKAGIQRGSGRGAPTPTPHRHSRALFSRHSCEGRNPEGRWRPFALREIEGGTGAGRGNPITENRRRSRHPPHPVVGAFRERPVPPQRDPRHSITASACRPTPTSPSFPRRREPHLPQQTPSTNPPNPTVVPAFAGTQGRCAARWRLRPPSFPPPNPSFLRPPAASFLRRQEPRWAPGRATPSRSTVAVPDTPNPPS